MRAGRVPRLAVVCAVTAIFARLALGAGVPPETADRLERAFKVLDQSFVGSYTVTVRGVVEKPGGKDRQETLRVIAMSRLADGSSEGRIVKALDNGNDVTDKERARAAKATPRPVKTPKAGSAAGSGGKDTKSDSVSAELKLPTGKDAALYRFAAPTEEGDLVVVAYEPLPEHRKDDGVTKGRIAWHRGTLDPAWFETEMLVLPTGASQLVMRFQFARQGDLLYPSLTTTRGAGGILWIKRNFEARMEITDLTPAAEATAAAVGAR